MTADIADKNMTRSEQKQVLKMLRISRAMLLAGLLLLLLGAGNLLVGYHRADDYEALLEEYHEQHPGILNNTLPAQTTDKNLQYLEARYGFYRFCILGGKCFLALAAICMLTSLILLPSGESAPEIDGA